GRGGARGGWPGGGRAPGRVAGGAAPGPGAVDGAADLVEAAAASGQPERARQVLAQLERQAAGSALLPAVVARCHVLLGSAPAAPDGDPPPGPAGPGTHPFARARPALCLAPP